MDVSPLIGKYTGHPIPTGALAVARATDGITAALAAAIAGTAYQLHSTETELGRLAARLTDSAAAARAAITAEPDQPTPPPDPFGVLGSAGSRFDTLIAVRARHIEHLRELVHLWHELPH